MHPSYPVLIIYHIMMHYHAHTWGSWGKHAELPMLSGEPLLALSRRDCSGPQADRLLRVLVSTKEPTQDYSVDWLPGIRDEEEAVPSRFQLAVDARGWHASVA